MSQNDAFSQKSEKGALDRALDDVPRNRDRGGARDPRGERREQAGKKVTAPFARPFSSGWGRSGSLHSANLIQKERLNFLTTSGYLSVLLNGEMGTPGIT